MTTNDFDALVVGGGHNGLVCAAYLARSGKKVVVLEEHDVLGGACRTEELFPGCRVSTGALWSGMLRKRIIDDLELKTFGYSTIRFDPQVVSLQPDGGRITFWRNRLRTGAGILRLRPQDASGLLRLSRLTRKVVKALDELAWQSSPSLAQAHHVIARYAGDAAAKVVLRSSLAELLDDYVEDERIAGALAAAPVSISNARPFAPSTAYHFFYMMSAETHGRRGEWGFSVGGMGGTTEALARSATASGVVIRRGARVRRLLISEGTVVGVEIEGGLQLRSDIVISNADPRRTFLELVGPSNLSARFVQGVAETRNQGMATAIHALLDRLPDTVMQSGKGDRLEPYKGVFVISPSIEYVDRAYTTATNDGVSTNPVVTFCFPSVHDVSVAPRGSHLLSAFVQFTPYASNARAVALTQDTVYRRVMQLIAAHFPNILERVVEYTVFTPRDIEMRFGMSGGHPEHVDMRLDQLFENRPFPDSGGCHTPVRGLYLCGAGIHPGGTVTGIPGHNTARQIIQEWSARVGRARM